MRFEPVFLDADRELHGRVSQTFLRIFNNCPRAGYLSQQTKGQARTVEMVRGSCCHAIYEAGEKLMLAQGEPMLPPELIKVIVDEKLAEYPVPIEEHDFIREQAYRWASEWTIDPEAVIACEDLIVLEVGGYQVRVKVDHAELRGAQIIVADYKTGKGAPNYDEISRKRPRYANAHGSSDTGPEVSGRNFQLIIYCVALVYGRPVRVTLERCLNCESDPETGVTDLCTSCGGSGLCRVEEVQPLPLAPHAQEAIASFVYPAIEDSEGRMLRRTVGLTRLEIEEYRASLETIVARVAEAERTGDWPAVISDQACDQCPCKARCPIPAELRDHQGEINSLEDLQEAAERYYIEGKLREAKRKEIKMAARAYGGPSARVRYGKDRVWEFGPVRKTTEIKDKDGLFAAVERAVEFGEPFERSEFVKSSETTPFVDRALSEAELAEEGDA